MMELNQKIYDHFEESAGGARILLVSLGLGYTLVTTTDGGMGLSYTYFDRKTGCSLIRNYRDFEGRPAIHMLELIRSEESLERSMAMALVNALNHRRALGFPEDPRNEILLERMGIEKGSRVAMVGHFGPLIKDLDQIGALVSILDYFRGEGDKEVFYEKLHEWADALILTATTLLNNTAEEILSHVGTGVRTVILGPSTPLVPEAFSHLPVTMLAGMAPLDEKAVHKIVRHGIGTRYFGGICRKVYCSLT
jgi:uncharacterized protein (DUF4213/DUF364 family)